MSEQTSQEPHAVTTSFSEHLRAFHDSLPPEEQALLEQVVALAEAAAQEQDTSGYQAETVQGLRLPTLHLWLSSRRDSTTETNSLINAWPKKYTGL